MKGLIKIVIYETMIAKKVDKVLDKISKKLIEKGGIVREELSRDLWYLVTNDSKGEAKNYNKARKLGVTFIDETEFLKMLK